MAKAKEVMDVALSYLGYKESPPNSNKTIFGEVYGLNGQPWCCIFVWFCFNQIGANKLFFDGKKIAYVPSVVTWGKKYSVDKYSGQYGDIVIFDWQSATNGDGDHIGFINKNLGNGQYECVEGNTSIGNYSNGGEVMLRNRSVKNILMIIRPQYEDAISTPTINKDVEFIKAVQFSVGAKVDGIVGKETLSKCPTISCTLNVRHRVVKYVQAKLISLGINCGTCGADGIYGNATKLAVVTFQRKYGLTPDGIIGKKTWSKLLGI